MKKQLFLLMTIFTIAAWACPAAAYEAGGVNIHGFISQGFLYSSDYNYLAHNSKDGSFEYNEVGINFSKQLTDKLRIGLQLFSRDLGDAGNNKILLDWAYGDYQFKDWLGLRAGRIKIPMGLYNDTRDIDMLRTFIVLPQGIYNDFERDNLIAVNGAGLHGNVDMKGVGGLEYQFNVGAVNTDLESGFGKVAVDDLAGMAALNGDIDNGTTYNGALRWETPLPGLRLSYTHTYEDQIDMPLLVDMGLPVDLEGVAGGNATIQVYSAEYTWNDLVVAAEYMNREIDGGMSITGVAGTQDMSSTAESYYLSASYRFNDWFTLGAYYGEFYPNKDDKDGEALHPVSGQPVGNKAWEKDLALTLRFDINEYWVIKVEGHAVDGTARVFLADNTDNDFSEDQWYYGAAKVTFNF